MDLSLAEIARYMRMGSQTPEGALADRVRALRDAALPVFAPRRVFRRWARADLGFVSRKLDRNLAGCRDCYLLCATIGASFDALLRRVSSVSGTDALIAQAVGAAAIEKFVDACEMEVQGYLARGETLAPRYSPGYGDFPLEANQTILELLDASRKTGVSLTDTLLLVPSKSVTAVIGVRPPDWTESPDPKGTRP